MFSQRQKECVLAESLLLTGGGFLYDLCRFFINGEVFC